MQYDEIVGISDAILDLQLALEEMIELVHVHIHQKLAREIAERQTDPWSTLGMEASDHLA